MDEKDDIPVIRIIFTTEDVRDIAEAHGIDLDVAYDRAAEWGRYIEQTMSGYCAEQLEDAIRTGQV